MQSSTGWQPPAGADAAYPRGEAEQVSSRRRILHLITRFEPGGAQRNTLYTVGHLDRSQFSVGLAWGPGDLLDADARAITHIRHFELPFLRRPVRPRADLLATIGLRRVIREFAPEVVHTHSSKAGILGRLAARFERVPVVVHSIHGFGFTPVQPVVVRAAFFAAERLARRWTDHFIAVSRTNLELGVKLGLFDRDQVSLIRSGIELGRFRVPAGGAELRRRLGLPAAAPLITQIGNFKAQKAPLDFVRMAAQLARRHPELRFVMVGDGPLRAAAAALVGELGIADRVCLCGWLDDVVPLLDATTVSVLSSRHEGLPRAVVESLAAGVPVVATAVDGTAEVVHPGRNGFLVPPGDVDALVAKVCTLVEQPELRAAFSRAARTGLDEFDIGLMVRQQEELYTCLLGRNPS